MAKTVMTVSAHEFELFTEFYIEELRPNGKWRRIPTNAGPYSSSETAGTFAKKYSVENHVKTRVVGEE